MQYLYLYTKLVRKVSSENITVFGNTDYKKKFKIKYENKNLKNKLFSSQTKSYVNKFIDLQKKYNFSIIEVHNRPSYINILSKKLDKKIFSLFFHNDPLSMDGSKTINDRKKLLKTCHKIIFNSNWSKKRFLEGLENKFVNSDKLVVFNLQIKKIKV